LVERSTASHEHHLRLFPVARAGFGSAVLSSPMALKVGWSLMASPWATWRMDRKLDSNFVADNAQSGRMFPLF